MMMMMIDTADPRRLRLVKQAEVDGMLKDMKGRRAIDESVLTPQVSCSSGKLETFGSVWIIGG
jgi:hypothetical protein